MSETVWFEQVDTALIDFISKGIKIGYSPIDVRVRKPDEDFKKEDYPLISLYNVYSKRDDFRRCFEPVPVEKNVETKTIVMEQAALPYNLFYQIDFWSLQQSQMNSMLMQWVSLTQGGKDFNLPVNDAGGNSRSCYCLCKDDFKKSDLVDGNKRIFHSFITYRIYVEIDENIRISEPMITDVGITTNKEV